MSKLSANLDEKNTAKFPFMVLAVSILLTVAISYIFYQSAKNKDTVRFNNEVKRIHLAIESKVNLYTDLLKGGRGLIESNPDITREHFAEYIRSLELEKNHSGVQGIGYAKIVTAENRDALVKKMKAEGNADFSIFPTGEKKSYCVTVYLEPQSEINRKAVGFDMSADSVRREALELAGDSATSVTSRKIVLSQGKATGRQNGFFIYLPVYKDGKVPATVEERRRNLTGYIYSPFRSDDFINEVQNDISASDISLKIYDGEVNEENLLARTSDPADSIAGHQTEENYTTQNDLNAAGKKWTVQYVSLPVFTAQSSLDWTPWIFIIGMIASFLLFGMTFWESFARSRLRATAAELFELEKQKQILLEKEQKARLSAEQANITKDEFIAVVSHELRTPLNAIAGWARILKTDDLSGKTKELALEKIEKNLRLQTKLVEELLEYSQIISGTIAFEGKDVNFSNVFENAFSEIESAAQEKNIELLKNNQLNGHLILGEEDKIKIVIYNLLTNAVKFTHSGGRIETAVSEIDGKVQMIIKDNGIGISADFLPLIFDRFTQADASITRNSGGFGLGLTISNHIVKLHNGTIEAVSAGKGKGAIFTVRVPLKS